MEKMNDLNALLQHEVQDLISVEDQIIQAMPAMIERAKNASLKKALQDHLAVTEKQRTRLDKIQQLVSDANNGNKGFLSNLLKKLSPGKKCKGMEGIITEGQSIMKEDMNPDVMDAAIIACAQKIEHYEICGYGTAKAYAAELEMKEAEKLLDETLSEEYEADDLLTELAVGNINQKAEKGSGKRAGSSAPKKVAAKKSAPAPKKVAAKKAAPKKAAAKKTK